MSATFFRHRRLPSRAAAALAVCLAAPSDPRAATLGDGVWISVTGRVQSLYGPPADIDYVIGYDGVTAVGGRAAGPDGHFGLPVGGAIAIFDLAFDIRISTPGKESVVFDFVIDHQEGSCFRWYPGGDIQCLGNPYGSKSVYAHRTITEDEVYRINFWSSGVFDIPSGETGEIDYGYIESYGSPWVTIRIDPDLAAARSAAALEPTQVDSPAPVPLPPAGLLLAACALPLRAVARRRAGVRPVA